MKNEERLAELSETPLELSQIVDAACLMLDASDWPQLKGYVEHVRPLLDPASPAPPWW